MLTPIQIDPETFLRQHCTLPALPASVMQLQNMMSHGDDCNMAEIAELISSDPGLVAQVLKVVNSAYFGLPTEITKVRYAITFLGLHEVHRIILSLSVVNSMNIPNKDELKAFWYHSLYAAACTKSLAKRYARTLSFEELWSAAILHDIGKLVYLKFFPDHYEALRSFSKERGVPFREAESHFSFPSSGYLGSLLCDRWRLPNRIKRACEFHTLKDLKSVETADPAKAFERMVCLGNLFAVLSTSELNAETKQEIGEEVKRILNLSEADFLTVMGDIYELGTEVDAFVARFC